jgi:hypothetical protein
MIGNFQFPKSSIRKRLYRENERGDYIPKNDPRDGKKDIDESRKVIHLDVGGYTRKTKPPSDLIGMGSCFSWREWN